jgi:hypothetical protein
MRILGDIEASWIQSDGERIEGQIISHLDYVASTNYHLFGMRKDIWWERWGGGV